MPLKVTKLLTSAYIKVLTYNISNCKSNQKQFCESGVCILYNYQIHICILINCFMHHSNDEIKRRRDWGEMKQGQVKTVTITFMGDGPDRLYGII